MRVGLVISALLAAGGASAGSPGGAAGAGESETPPAAGAKVEPPGAAAGQPTDGSVAAPVAVEPSDVPSPSPAVAPAAGEPSGVSSASPAAAPALPGSLPADSGTPNELDASAPGPAAGGPQPASDSVAAPMRPSTSPASRTNQLPLRLSRRQKLQRSGLFGWGLGLEAPMVGVMTGIAQRSDPGWGYWLGGALSWEANPRFLLRLVGAVGQTYGGKAGVRYIGNVQTSELTRSGQPAELLAAELGLGGAYLFRSVERAWTPLVGIDLGYAFYGYDFALDDTLEEEIGAVDVGDAFRQCTDAACRSDQHDGMMFGPTVTLRGGVRLELTRWLASQAEIALTYLSLREERISNTVLSRQVTTAPESILMVRMLFTVRMGL